MSNGLNERYGAKMLAALCHVEPDGYGAPYNLWPTITYKALCRKGRRVQGVCSFRDFSAQSDTAP